MKTLTELKKTTLKSYIKKANDNTNLQGYIHGKSKAATQPWDSNSPFHQRMMDRAMRKGENRQKGVERAVEKLEEGTEVWALPTVLVLRRKTIRNFSDGTQVALYYNDRLDKYFSIPFRTPIHSQDDPITVSESLDLINFQSLVEAVKHHLPSNIILDSEQEFTINEDDSIRLLSLYEGIDDSNKTLFLQQLKHQDLLEHMIELARTE